MTRKRTIGSMAAAAGLAVAVAWLTAPPAARADELSDMRADMQLLQQRMDQLAQFAPGTTGGAAYGTKPAPGAAIVGGSFPRSFLIPGTDTSIRIGGTASLVADYWTQGGPPNGTQTTDLGANGQALFGPLNFKAFSLSPGLPTGRSNRRGTGGRLTQIVPQPSSVFAGIGSQTAIAANARGNGIFSMSHLQSDFQVETRTPTAFGEARSFMQFDFAGCDNFSCSSVNQVSNPIIPRIKYFYGTLGGFLAGQANSNFADNDAGPETIDFGGDVGQAGVNRVAQVRYTYPGPWGMALSGSLESPDTDAITPGGHLTSDQSPAFVPAFATTNANTTGCVANGITQGGVFSPNFSATSTCIVPANPLVAKAPDFTLSDYWAQPWGHIDLRFVGRDLSINDGRFVSRSLFGYGGGISGTIIPKWFGWNKDNLVAQVNIGNGIGRYINDADSVGVQTNYASLVPQCAVPTDGCTFSAREIAFQRVPEQGASAGYQHWWLPNLRSNITFGWQHYEISSTIIGPLASVQTNKQVWTAHLNLIWSPVGFIDTGVEWLYSSRQTLAGLYGIQNALIYNFIVKF